MVEIKKIYDFYKYKKELKKIQMSAWGFSEYEIEAHHLMTRVQKYGGLVQGLFEDEKLIGFTYAVLGKWKGEYFIYSHQLAVLQEYQSKGYGYLLKKAQREEVLKMGYGIIKWSFDPLESLNSFFNIHRLGVISEEYEENVYGIGEYGLHEGLPTDRLVAQWILKSDRVVARMERKYPLILEDVQERVLGDISGEKAYIEIPLNIREIKGKDKELAYKWRLKTRDQFNEAFQKGYVAAQIVFTSDKKRVFYKLVQKEK